MSNGGVCSAYLVSVVVLVPAVVELLVVFPPLKTCWSGWWTAAAPATSQKRASGCIISRRVESTGRVSLHDLWVSVAARQSAVAILAYLLESLEVLSLVWILVNQAPERGIDILPVREPEEIGELEEVPRSRQRLRKK